MIKVFKQLLKEFWIPLTIATIWTGVNIIKVHEKPLDWTDYINIGVTAFFFVSWMTGQFFRVRKQENISSSLDKIEARVNSVLGDISKQANNMKIISDRQLYQTFDICLDSIRDAREELADISRQFMKVKTYDIEKFSFKRDNPLYRCKLTLNTLVSYALYTHNFELNHDLIQRYTRTAYFSEEVVGTVTSFLNQLSHFGQNWQTDKSKEILKDIHDNLEKVKTKILKDTIYVSQLYKNNSLELVLDRHLNSLKKLIE